MGTYSIDIKPNDHTYESIAQAFYEAILSELDFAYDPKTLNEREDVVFFIKYVDNSITLVFRGSYDKMLKQPTLEYDAHELNVDGIEQIDNEDEIYQLAHRALQQVIERLTS